MRRAAFACVLVLALFFGQVAALAHDVTHLDEHAPSSLECDSHYAASQMGGGPLPAMAFGAIDFAAAPADSRLRQRDASIPQRVAYLSQAPPSALR